MAYTLNDWSLAHDEMPEEPENNGFKSPVEGDWYLQILDAVYDASTGKYIIKFYDCNNELQFTMTYFLNRKEGGKNFYTYKTLKSLADALFFGADLTIPNPADIIGTVVIGRVTLTKPKEDDPEARRYARIFEYFPVPQNVAEDLGKKDADGNIAQYYEGRLD